MKKLFLDDIRTIEMVYDKSVESEFDIVRTYHQFVSYIQEKGLPNFISFDNDLGLNEHGEVALDGYAAAKWLVYESGLDLRNLEFKVHSANPVATEQIKGLLTNYIQHLNHTNKHKIGSEFKAICKEIEETNNTLSEWQLVESDDQFQTDHYSGGFDGIEQEFTFSYYDNQRIEYWFQLSINQILEINKGGISEIELRKPDKNNI